ncbi:MAG: fumarate hydratase, partial [Proteobacteria bacterium]|nr:fumarate hydratase [Pseudomonadota bacterium]
MLEIKNQYKTVHLKVPVQAEDLDALTIGTIVYLDGIIYTGREGVYKRVIEEG